MCTVGESLEPVAIGRLERWVGDMAISEGWANVPYIERNGFKVGIVGSGPAGMACAADMAKAGCDVTVYEAFHEPGGVLKYGIPDFRLPNAVIDVEIEKLTRLGIKFECNTLVGRLFTIEQMITEMGFHAVFIGTGAGYPSFMGIPGESLNGVLSANELLTRCNLMRARDFPISTRRCSPGAALRSSAPATRRWTRCASASRLGAEHVYCVYRRTKPRRRRARKRSTTRARKASSSTGSPAPSSCLPTTRIACAACAASAWSWASPTRPAAGVRSRSRAASSRSKRTWSCSRSAPTPIRSSARRRS